MAGHPIKFTIPNRFITHTERARRIDAILKRKGKTRYWLNQQMGYASRGAYRLVNLVPEGEKDPDPRMTTLIRMATVLGCSVGFLVDRKETKPRGKK